MEVMDGDGAHYFGMDMDGDMDIVDGIGDIMVTMDIIIMDVVGTTKIFLKKLLFRNLSNNNKLTLRKFFA